MSKRDRGTRGPARVATAVVIAALVVLAFASLGGVGLAKTSSSAAEYQYGKVTICHHAGPHGKRVTITVSRNALPAHMRHGDTMGPCPTSSQKSQKAKAKAAAKAKAETKAKAESKTKAKAESKAKTESKAKAETKAAAPKAETKTKAKAGERGKSSGAAGKQPAQPAAPPAPAPSPAPAPAPDNGNGKAHEDKGNNGDNGNGNGKGKGKG